MHYQYDGLCSTAPRTYLNSRLYFSALFTLTSENGFGKKVAHGGWKYCKHSNLIVLLECSHAALHCCISQLFSIFILSINMM